MKLYECKVSFTFDANNPLEAAQQFLVNIQTNPNWFVDVKDVDNGAEFTVDTEDGSVETKIHLDENQFDAKVETELGTYYVRNTYDIDNTNGGITGVDIYNDEGKYVTNVSGLSVYVEDGWELDGDGKQYNCEDIKEIADWIENNLEL
jgi:hypothetical protein